MDAVIPKDEITRLRQQSGDSAVFTHLLSSDPKFKEGVDKVQAANPNMGAFDKLKMPSAMLDLYYGIDSPKVNPVNTNAAQNIMREQPMASSPESDSALAQAVEHPLSFAADTLMNVPGSAYNLGKSMVGAVMHPIQTGKTLLQLGVGGTANTIEKIADLAGVKNAEDIFDLESEDVASAVGKFYVERYGSIDAAAKTLRDDPVGFLSDAASVVAGFGSIVRGGATALGAITGEATSTATALTKTGRAIRIAQNAGEAIMQKGINMEPVVIAGKGVFMAGRGLTKAIIGGAGPEAMVHKALKMNPNQMRNFMKEHVAAGETPAGYLLRKGVSGTKESIMDDLEKIAQKSKATVDNELASVSQTYDLIDDAPDVFKALSEIQDTAKQFKLDEELSFTNDLIKKERLTLTDVNSVKRRMDDLYYMYSKSSDPTASLTAERLRRVRDGIKTFIEDESESKGLQDVRLLNKDTQLSRALLNDIEHSMIGKWGNNAISLSDYLTAGVAGGATGSNPLAMAGVVLLKKAGGSVLFRTTLAKYLHRLTSAEMNPLLRLMRDGKMTKDAMRIIRRVAAQAAEDIKQHRVGTFEKSLGALQVMERASNAEQSSPAIEEVIPAE